MENTNITKVFEEELNLTEQGFIELVERKKGLVIDVTTDDGFKLARKERTEMNRIHARIDRLAIDGKSQIDASRNDLKSRVSDIYAVNVEAFEKEDAKRKEEKKRKEIEKQERIKKIKDEINKIHAYADNANYKSSQELQDIIEAIDLIDVIECFPELTKEASEAKELTLSKLNAALSFAIQKEQFEEKTKKLEEREVALSKVESRQIELNQEDDKKTYKSDSISWLLDKDEQEIIKGIVGEEEFNQLAMNSDGERAEIYMLLKRGE